MKKSSKIIFGSLVLATVLFLSACGGESVDKLKSYLDIASQAYEVVITNVMSALATTGEYEKLDKTCQAHMKIQTFWNLGIDALQAYLENKDQSTSEVVVNLASAKEVMRSLFEELQVDPKIRLYVDVAISTTQVVIVTILPNIQVEDGVAVDLAYLKINVACPDPTTMAKTSVKPMSTDTSPLLNTIKSQSERTPEMEALIKELESK